MAVMFTSQHYIALAAWLKEQKGIAVKTSPKMEHQVNQCMLSLCDVLEKDNSNFNRQLFIESCYGQSEKCTCKGTRIPTHCVIHNNY